MKIIPLVILVCCVGMASLSGAISPKSASPALAAGVQDSKGALQQAPELTCKTPDGQPMSWADYKERVVILYFHAVRTLNAGKALEQFGKSLASAPELRERCSVLLVVDDAEAGRKARVALLSSGYDIDVGVSEGREFFQSYGVVAYPTLYIINPQARIVDSVRGYGTLFSFHALAACRLALGIIDRETFDGLLHGKRKAPRAEDLTKSRKYLMARKLMSIGKREAALAILIEHAAESPPRPHLIALVAHLLLFDGDASAARLWVDRLGEVEPDWLDTVLLEARLELAAANPDGARSHLRGLDASNPRVEFVRALILEHEGRFEDAAAMYRGALSSTLFLPE